MDSPKDVQMDDGNSRVHEPFTVEENIHQLNAIDKSIVDLMNHTATALNALTIPINSPDSQATLPQQDPSAKKAAFRGATDSFLDTLHAVDVKMKRQIMALEEAGIVNLSAGAKQEPGSSGPKTASLKPNGMGAVGNLDVGWLNSHGSRVERDMEAELWADARKFLEKEGSDIKLETLNFPVIGQTGLQSPDLRGGYDSLLHSPHSSHPAPVLVFASASAFAFVSVARLLLRRKQ
ncbi:unnamed protein product [Clonostachys byssicola]|uniref:Mediator of RNA polymerase II transcription subunit 11 n=1 Tax=Clonostachys byssicola TaxID=160290 RepID=A0A9N9UPC1_9HYPO|nr:unnamed protein product [Clonostachys byssicola]